MKQLAAVVLWAAVLCPWALAEPTTKPVDPMVLVPIERIEGLRRLSDADYAKRSAAFEAAIAPGELVGPGIGRKLVEVVPGSFAEKSGWAADDMIFGMTLKGKDQLIGMEDKTLTVGNPNRPEKVTVWSAKTKTEKTFDLPPGRIGIESIPHVEPLQLYAGLKDERQGKWDRDMLIAAAALAKDPDLAEAALARAMDAGAKGWTVPTLAALIAWKQGRADQVVAAGELAMRTAPAPYNQATRWYVRVTAMATYKLPLSLELLEKDEPETFAEAKAVWVPAMKAYKEAKVPPRLPPADRMDVANQVDLREEMKPLDLGEGSSSKWAMGQLEKNGEIPLKIPRGSYRRATFEPAKADFDFSFQIAAKPTKGDGTRWSETFALGFMDVSNADAPRAMQVRFFSTGAVEVELAGGSFPIIVPRRETYLDGQPMTVRVIVLGPDVQFLLNDHTIFYGPAPFDPAKRKLAPMFTCVGLDGRINEVEFWEPKK